MYCLCFCAANGGLGGWPRRSRTGDGAQARRRVHSPAARLLNMEPPWSEDGRARCSSRDGGQPGGRSPPLEDARSALRPMVLGGVAAADLSRLILAAYPRPPEHGALMLPPGSRSSQGPACPSRPVAMTARRARKLSAAPLSNPGPARQRVRTVGRRHEQGHVEHFAMERRPCVGRRSTSRRCTSPSAPNRRAIPNS